MPASCKHGSGGWCGRGLGRSLGWVGIVRHPSWFPCEPSINQSASSRSPTFPLLPGILTWRWAWPRCYFPSLSSCSYGFRGIRQGQQVARPGSTPTEPATHTPGVSCLCECSSADGPHNGHDNDCWRFNQTWSGRPLFRCITRRILKDGSGEEGKAEEESG